MIVDSRAKYQLPSLRRIDGEAGGRYYITPEGVKAWSMTNVLGKTASNAGWADEWKKRVGAAEAARVSSIATRRGSSVHELLELSLTNTEWPVKGFSPDAIMLAASIKKYFIPLVNEVRAIEAQLYCTKLKIAGTVDFIAVVDGIAVVGDWKTSKRIKTKSEIEDYFIQVAGYADMWHGRTGEVIADGIVVIACDDSLQPLIFKFKVKDYLKALYRRVNQFHKLIAAQ